jgi:hypothetical protein
MLNSPESHLSNEPKISKKGLLHTDLPPINNLTPIVDPIICLRIIRIARSLTIVTRVLSAFWIAWHLTVVARFLSAFWIGYNWFILARRFGCCVYVNSFQAFVDVLEKESVVEWELKVWVVRGVELLWIFVQIFCVSDFFGRCRSILVIFESILVFSGAYWVLS